MENDTNRILRVGALVTVSLVILMLFLFFIGSEKRFFSRKFTYEVRLESVSGLAEGSPVQLAGVTIGSVAQIYLPRDPSNRTVDITISVDRKFSDRIRHDSRARIRKLGLIASDSYVDITPGSPDEPPLDPGSIIPAHRSTDVDALISSGEDLVDNFVQISYSMKNVLQRIDRGEGLIGELTTSPESKEKLTEGLGQTLSRVNGLLDKVERGEGLLGMIVSDDEFAVELTTSLTSAVNSLSTVATSVEEAFESGDGMLPAMLHDPDGKQKLTNLVDQLAKTSDNLAEFSNSLSGGEGLLPRLVEDEEYAEDFLDEFLGLVKSLAETARKLENGEGTAGKLISDPGAYEALNDILIGINESRMLRWLLRNRQQTGIETRYDAVQDEKEGSSPDG